MPKRRWTKKLGVQHYGNFDICKLFSPTWVSKEAVSQGLRGGWGLDLNHVDEVTNKKWDLGSLFGQQKVWRMLGRFKPLVVGLSPECTPSSQLQNLGKTEIDPVELFRAVECVRFSVRIAEHQIKKGRFLYFEHPLLARCLSTMEEL